jgi:hypothetical protein
MIREWGRFWAHIYTMGAEAPQREWPDIESMLGRDEIYFIVNRMDQETAQRMSDRAYRLGRTKWEENGKTKAYDGEIPVQIRPPQLWPRILETQYQPKGTVKARAPVEPEMPIPEDATVGRLRERVVDWMRQRGQGEDWTIGGADREAIDFDFEYPVTAIEREVPIDIYLKQ